MTRARASLGALLALAALLACPRARAQTPPPGAQLPAETFKPKPATTGSTNLPASTFAAGNAVQEVEEQHATSLSVSLGGLFSSGNARTIALTSAAKLRVRRYEHQITAGAAVNFARVADRGTTRAQTTVENYQALGRYDFFVSQRVSLFLQATTRRDRFQGLDFRLNGDPGVAYHFIQTKNQRLIAEVGYDVQHDIRNEAARVTTTPPVPPATEPTVVTADKTRTLHNARTFVGYENRLYPEMSFIASIEHIQNFHDRHLYRLVFDAGVRSTLKGKLAVALTYTMRYENRPLPDVQKADSLASLSLVYTLF